MYIPTGRDAFEITAIRNINLTIERLLRGDNQSYRLWQKHSCAALAPIKAYRGSGAFKQRGHKQKQHSAESCWVRLYFQYRISAFETTVYKDIAFGLNMGLSEEEIKAKFLRPPVCRSHGRALNKSFELSDGEKKGNHRGHYSHAPRSADS